MPVELDRSPDQTSSHVGLARTGAFGKRTLESLQQPAGTRARADVTTFGNSRRVPQSDIALWCDTAVWRRFGRSSSHRFEKAPFESESPAELSMPAHTDPA